MTEKEEEECIKILHSKPSWKMLKYLFQNGTARYKDFTPFASTYTLNKRLKEFLKYNLIQHRFVKADTRKEWYELTDKGREIFLLLRKTIAIMEEKEEDEIMGRNVISEK